MDPLLWLLIALFLGVAGGWRLLRRPPAPQRIQISALDPLLDEARSQVQASLPRLQQLLLEHPGRVLIKFRIPRDDGRYQGQWAEVVTHDPGGLQLRTRGLGRRLQLPWSEIEDWQVELDSGVTHGGFTVVAAWRIQHRQSGRWPTAARRWLPRFLDVPDPGSSAGGGGSKPPG
ncbi:MAG TPA: hypothetical protein ENK18_04740 [Deltaproteobacteria bacterium]|nr:hypothetical protein [Deltaproteobacteria bacterium]